MKKLFFRLFPTWSNPADQKKIDRLNDKISDIHDAMITMNRSHKALERERMDGYNRLLDRLTQMKNRFDECDNLIRELDYMQPEKKYDPLIDGKWYMVWNGGFYNGFAVWLSANKKFYKPKFGYTGQTEKEEIPGTDWLLIDLHHIKLSETTIFF